MLYSKEKLDEALNYLVNKQSYHGNDYLLNMLVSPLRENILSWYPFTKKDEVLLVGGATSGLINLLCNHTKEVTTLEYNEEYLSFVKEGYSFFDNLKSYNIDEINNLNYFDYIIVNGSFREQERDLVSFISLLQIHLNNHGKILFSIDNKFATKFISGEKDIYSNKYIDNSSLSKEEITCILNKLHYQYKYYYPYPDFAFCNEVFTDKTLYSMSYGKPYINLSNNRYDLKNECDLISNHIHQKDIDIYANSYLVEISKETLDNDINYVKINNDRNDNYKIATILYNNQVEKKALTLSAKNHIENMNSHQNNSPSINIIDGKLKDNSIFYPYLELKSLKSIVEKFINDKDKESIITVIQSFFDLYSKESKTSLSKDFYSNEFQAIFGQLKIDKEMIWIDHPNIDLILDNIYLDDNKYTIIDPEWILDIKVPLLFIIWRSIKNLYDTDSDIHNLIDENDLLKEFDISVQDEEVFKEWEKHFISCYVGSNERKYGFNSIISLNRDKTYIPKLRIGEDSNSLEEHSLNCIQKGSCYNFNIPKKLVGKYARVILLENTATKLIVNTKGCNILDSSAVKYDGLCGYFINDSIYYDFIIQDTIVSFKCNYENLNYDELVHLINTTDIQRNNPYQRLSISFYDSVHYSKPQLLSAIKNDNVFKVTLNTKNVQRVTISFLDNESMGIKLLDATNKYLYSSNIIQCDIDFDIVEDYRRYYEFDVSKLDEFKIEFIKKQISLESNLLMNLRYIPMKIYYDIGNGFNENIISYLCSRVVDSYFKANFELLQECKKIRFDPIEGEYCLIDNLQISENLQLVKDNTKKFTFSKTMRFNTFDPWLVFKVKDSNKQIYISGNIHTFTKE